MIPPSGQLSEVLQYADEADLIEQLRKLTQLQYEGKSVWYYHIDVLLPVGIRRILVVYRYKLVEEIG